MKVFRATKTRSSVETEYTNKMVLFTFEATVFPDANFSICIQSITFVMKPLQDKTKITKGRVFLIIHYLLIFLKYCIIKVRD